MPTDAKPGEDQGVEWIRGLMHQEYWAAEAKVQRLAEDAAKVEAADLDLARRIREYSDLLRNAMEVIGRPPKHDLGESIAALREAGGYAWDDVEDPAAYLREIRGEG